MSLSLKQNANSRVNYAEKSFMKFVTGILDTKWTTLVSK